MRHVFSVTATLWVVAACEATEAASDARDLLDAAGVHDASEGADTSGSEDALALFDALAPDSPGPDAPGVPRDVGLRADDGDIGPSPEDGGQRDAAEDAATCAGTLCDEACVDTSSAVEHCGDCRNDCRALPGVDVASVACERGACVIVACLTRLADCDGASENGCEVSLRSDDRNCGACGMVCSAPTDLCMNGECR